MTSFPAESLSSRPFSHSRPGVAATRAVAAVIWAVVFLAVLHGQRVLTGDKIPVAAGLLLAAYPLIDLAASLSERRRRLDQARPGADVIIDGLAVVGLLVTTLAFHTGAVLVVFGTWALASGLLQLVRAWRGETSRWAQAPLIVSGAISAIAGFAFSAMATEHTAHLANLGGYAVLGAVFFLVWTYLNRGRSTSA